MKKIIGWYSVAYWPAEINLYNSDNTSDDKHDSYKEAAAICRRLRSEGFGGDCKVFPTKVEVRPIYSEEEYNINLDRDNLVRVRAINSWETYDKYMRGNLLRIEHELELERFLRLSVMLDKPNMIESLTNLIGPSIPISK